MTTASAKAHPDAGGSEVETPSKPLAPQAPPTPAAAPAPIPAPMPPLRAAGYMLASLLLALTQGLGMNLISANLPQIQGALGATTNEATWLVAAYMAPNVSLSLALIKIRTQYGLRNFAELSILVFVLVSLMHLFVDDLHSALIVRFFSGIAAAPMSSLGFLYMLEPFPPAKKLNIGLSLALTNLSLRRTARASDRAGSPDDRTMARSLRVRDRHRPAGFRRRLPAAAHAAATRQGHPLAAMW